MILTRWREMMSYRDGTLLGEDIEELHSMRVSSRRLRAAMDAFEGAFPRKTFRPLLRQVKEITDVLGDARDLDVAIERLSRSRHRHARRRAPGHRGPGRALPRPTAPPRAPRSRRLFARLDNERFEERLARYMAKHTGIRLQRLEPTAARGLTVAKPRPVKGLDPDRRIRPNARQVLAVRIDEVYSFDGLVADPANVKELHDLRIACKRLRYLLEIFAIAFAEDLEPFIDEVKGLQDLLGDIHDCDVQIPMLEEHLAWLAGREGEAARRVVAGRAARRPAGGALGGGLPRVPPAARGRAARRRARRRARADRPPSPRARRALRPLRRRVAPAQGRALPAAPGGGAGHRCRLSGSPCWATSTPTPPPCAPSSPTSRAPG